MKERLNKRKKKETYAQVLCDINTKHLHSVLPGNQMIS